MREAGMTLFGKGAALAKGSFTGVEGRRPEKSPRRQLSSGTEGFSTSRAPLPRLVSKEKKKKVLFRPLYNLGKYAGPPIVKPGACVMLLLRCSAKGLRAINRG